MPQKLTVTVNAAPDFQPEWELSGTGQPGTGSSSDRSIHDLYTSDPETWLVKLGGLDIPKDTTPALKWLAHLCHTFLTKLALLPELEEQGEEACPEFDETWATEHLMQRPPMVGGEMASLPLLQTTWSQLHQAYKTLLNRHQGNTGSLFQSINPKIHLAGRIFFHLVENKRSELPFAFMATYTQQDGDDCRHLPLQKALGLFDDEQLIDLLSTVYTAAQKSPLIHDILDSGELFHPLAWDARDALSFLKEISIYESCGIICRIPNWWKPGAGRVAVNLSVGGKPPSYIGQDALVRFEPSLTIGDMNLTPEEVQQILEENEPMAFLKNRWVEVDQEKLKQALMACEKAIELSEDGIRLSDALRFQLRPELLPSSADHEVPYEISRGQWMDEAFSRLENPSKAPAVSPAPGFNATLRGYQEHGLNWLSYMEELGFGACLADDMGLGKTIQVLSYLHNRSKKAGSSPALLIIPASLLSNWTSEATRFTPELKWLVAHPDYAVPQGKETLTEAKKRLSCLTPQMISESDLIITTYAITKKYDWIHTQCWGCLILDEAQAIKNPATKQTQSIKQIRSHHRIVLTGTPVENRLGDLWSLFDFLNPGLLGNRHEFTQFVKSLKNDSNGYARLRTLISPFILRRLKTDTSIITDLPDKVTMKAFSGLSKKQIVLYKKGVQRLEEKLNTSSGMERRGLVLSSLMKFKQLCNHPDQYSGGAAYKEADSGKFTRLREICETVLAKRERVLIFTQFQELTEPLRRFLETIFNHPGVVLHGGIPVGKRPQLIETFQAEAYCPFMVLSLKAGGVGLNLTQANHVVHFDRWWNPAVENQATDRAFRIGQTRKVIVHTFVTKGTIEERIDAMLEEKQDLADSVISPSGETMITEMESDELIELFTLGAWHI